MKFLKRERSNLYQPIIDVETLQYSNVFELLYWFVSDTCINFPSMLNRDRNRAFTLRYYLFVVCQSLCSELHDNHGTMNLHCFPGSLFLFSVLSCFYLGVANCRRWRVECRGSPVECRGSRVKCRGSQVNCRWSRVNCPKNLWGLGVQ